MLLLSGSGFHASNAILRLARIFEALALCIQELHVYYQQLTLACPSPGLFHSLPDPTPASDCVSMLKSNFQQKIARSGDPLLDVAKSEGMPPWSRTVPSLALPTPPLRGKLSSLLHAITRMHILADKVLEIKLYACSLVVGDLYMVVHEPCRW